MSGRALSLRDQLLNLRTWIVGALDEAQFVYDHLPYTEPGMRETLAVRAGSFRVLLRLCDNLQQVQINAATLDAVRFEVGVACRCLEHDTEVAEHLGCRGHLNANAREDWHAVRAAKLRAVRRCA